MNIQEANRVIALSSFEIMDTSTEIEFDRIVRLGRQVAEADICYLSFVDDKRQYVKAAEGGQVEQATLRTETVCNDVILTRAPLMIEHLSSSHHLSHTSTYRKMRMTSYAGVPILTQQGHAIGTLAVFFEKSKLLSDRRMAALVDLAKIALRELAIRRAAKAISQNASSRAETPNKAVNMITRNHLKVLNSIREGVISVSKNGTINFINPAAELAIGRTASSVVGLPFSPSICKPNSADGAATDECAVTASLQDGVERIVRSTVFSGPDECDIRVEYIVSPLLINSEIIGALVVFRKVAPQIVSNGVELLHALRQVKWLKDQLSKVEPVNPKRMLVARTKPRDINTLDDADLLRFMSRHQDLESDQIMRMMAITGDVIDGPNGAANILNMDREAIRLKMASVKESSQDDGPQSRIDRWMS